MQESSYFAMVDLHGLSISDAERAINYCLTSSSRMNLRRIRFVTGRGNHINNSGKRGVLYESFPQWIESSVYKERIESLERHDGYYEVHLKETRQSSPITNFFSQTAEQILQANTNEIKIYAERGEAYFQLIYGKLLETGEGVKQNQKLAAQQYASAAEKGYAPAMHELARCYLHGLGVKQNDKTAFTWLVKADELNYLESTITIGDFYSAGIYVKTDGLKAVSYYAKALKAKHPLAMRKIANAYLTGIVKGQREENEKKSFKWYKESADLGDAISQYNTGTMLTNGTGTAVNDTLAVHYYKLSAIGGDPDGQFAYGYALYTGKGISENKEEGIEWLEKASFNGSAMANNLLIAIVKPSQREIYIKRAAQAGSIPEKFWLRLNGQNLEHLDDEEKDKLMYQAIRESYHLSVNDIIFLEQTSRFLLIDSLLKENKEKYARKAFEALEKMARGNCVLSMRRLSHIYMRGYDTINVKRNIIQAITLLHEAAECNDPKSLTLLGNLYLEGHFVTKSITIATNYYHRAIQQNYPPAFFYMAMLEVANLKNSDYREVLPRFVQFLETAIMLEKNNELLQSFTSGILDYYEPISKNAEEMLTKLNEDCISCNTVSTNEKAEAPDTALNNNPLQRSSSIITTNESNSIQTDPAPSVENISEDSSVWSYCRLM